MTRSCPAPSCGAGRCEAAVTLRGWGSGSAEPLEGPSGVSCWRGKRRGCVPFPSLNELQLPARIATACPGRAGAGGALPCGICRPRGRRRETGRWCGGRGCPFSGRSPNGPAARGQRLQPGRARAGRGHVSITPPGGARSPPRMLSGGEGGRRGHALGEARGAGGGGRGAGGARGSAGWRARSYVNERA